MDKTVNASTNLLAANQKLEFVCPRCKKDLHSHDNKFHCVACKSDYPIIAGIPDFRIFEDPYLTFEEDSSRTQIVLDAIDKYPLRELLTYYWSFSDVTPPYLREKFVENAMRGESRGKRLFDLILNNKKSAKSFIEIGCGTGNLLTTAVQNVDHVVGTDIAMRWLHLSRRRFQDMGLEVPALVCCCAEALPFKENSFDSAIMASTFEFLKQPDEALQELSRTMTSDGHAVINTVNRFSLTTNPYAHLWGVGFLAKSLQIKYVRKRRDASFENITLFSFRNIKKTTKKYFAQIKIELADISDKTLNTLPIKSQALVKLYRILKKIPLLNYLLKQVTPEWDIHLKNPIKVKR